MSISIARFIRIVSGVGGASGVRERDLIGRLFTASPRVPVSEVLEFGSAGDVAAFFGADSPEARRARFYFGFLSKSLGRARALSFARFVPTAEAGRIFGGKVGTLASLKTIVAGSLLLTVGGESADLQALDFSGAATYADVAATLQTQIRLAPGDAFTTASVAYNAVSGGFDLTLSNTGPGEISATGPSASALGWNGSAIISPGANTQTPSEALETAAQVSTNFGSFAFITPLDVAEVVEVAEWNAAQNVEYLNCVRVTDETEASLPPAIVQLGGTAMTYAPDTEQFDELLPMACFAATNYAARGATQNYMYQQANLSAKVTSNERHDALTSARVNFYGQTQSAGQRLAFYMNGVMTGTLTDPLDIGTFVNEIWFKDTARAALMSALLASGRIPANEAGRAQVLAKLQGVIDRALFNGVISTGKTLSDDQKAHVQTVTGDPDAWRQVQGAGYWIDAKVVLVPGTPPEYKIEYVLVYSKDDAIRRIDGVHDLI